MRQGTTPLPCCLGMYKMNLSLEKWPTYRLAWFALFITAFTLEAAALFFQYGMDLKPCIMCVYQRTAVMGLIFAGLVGMTMPKNFIVRVVAWVSWGVSAIWGFLIAQEHADIQANPEDHFFLTCDFLPNYPSWMPLHEWFPQVFNPTGDCGNIDWQFIGLSMPGWMSVIFLGYAAAFITVFSWRLLKLRKI